MKTIYEKSNCQNVLDFIHNWSKANTIGFSVKTLTKDFNEVCSTQASETQINKILYNLKNKKIMVGKGRGIYALSPNFSHQPAPAAPAAPAPAPAAAAPAIPAINTEEITIHNSTDQINNKKQACNRSEASNSVMKFIEKYSTSNNDFVFTIDQVAKEYPEISRNKLAKAIQNMYFYNQSRNLNKFKKGKKLGEYVFVATNLENTLIKQPETDIKQKNDEKIDLIKAIKASLKMDVNDDLKIKIINEIIQTL